MLKVFGFFRKAAVVLKGVPSSDLERMANDVVVRNDKQRDVEVVTRYIMPSGFRDKAAVYNYSEGRIYINLSLFDDVNFRNMVIGTYGSMDVYIDVLLSHELGHAYDPNFEGLAIMANNMFLPAQSRIEATLLLEENAWKYGRQYTLYLDKYEYFNYANMNEYKKALSI